MMTTWTAGLRAASEKASNIRRWVGVSNAFLVSGRLMVTVRTPSSSSCVSTGLSLIASSPIRSMQYLQRCLAEGAQWLAATHFASPERIVQQGAPDRDQVKLTAVETLHPGGEIVGRRGAAITAGIIKALVQTDPSHRHAQLAGDGLGPARQVAFRPWEYGPVEITHARIEDIDPGIRDRTDDLLQLLRRLSNPCAEILLLP